MARFFAFFVAMISFYSASMGYAYVSFDEPEDELSILQQALLDAKNLVTEACEYSYVKLTLSEEEGSLIYSIIETLADKNVLSLAFEKRNLESKGKQIDHVHPLRFIGHICSSATLNADLRIIEKSVFKWHGFMGGFTRRMIQEDARNNIFAYLPSFAEEMGVNQERVAAFCQDKDWEGLAKYLCHHAKTH